MNEPVEPDDELDRLAHEVVDAALQVHRVLGPGFLESSYVQSLQIELRARGIRFDSQVPVKVRYRDVVVGEGRIDLVVGGRLVVEAKAVSALAGIHLAQILSYLKAGGYRLGLVINFQVALLKDGIRRVVLS